MKKWLLLVTKIAIILSFGFLVGYKIGIDKAYYSQISLPIVNKFYFDDEQVEVRDGSPVPEYAENVCFINKTYNPERPLKYSCKEMIMDNYKFIEQECLRKVTKRLLQ